HGGARGAPLSRRVFTGVSLGGRCCLRHRTKGGSHGRERLGGTRPGHDGIAARVDRGDRPPMSGRADRPFVELHSSFSLSYVRRGSFGYRARGEEFELVAGSILVGHPGDEYTCTHDHVRGGDECLSFHLAPALADTIGERTEIWRAGCVPPLPELMVLGELAQAIAEGKNDLGLDEVGLLLAARLGEVVSGQKRTRPEARARDRRRA